MHPLHELFEDGRDLPADWLNRTIDHLANSSREFQHHRYGCPIFFAIDGQRFDGNDFIPDLMDSVPIFVSSRERPPDLPKNRLWIRRGRVRDCWAYAQRRWYSCPDRDLRLLAVTGTNGKTTTVFAIQHLLGPDCGRISTVDCQWRDFHLYNERTTLDGRDFYGQLDRARSAGLSALAFEASSQGLDQGRLYGATIETAIWTNFSRDHLDYHGSMDDYFRAKARLLDGGNGSRPRRILINGDESYGVRLLPLCPPTAELERFGLSPANDFRLLSWRRDSGRMLVTYSLQGRPVELRLSVFGVFNFLNLLAAAAAVHDWVPPEVLAERLETFTGAPGRLEPVAAPFPCFVDYAHTADGLTNVLGAVAEAFPDRPLVLVFGCGGNRDRGKRPAMVRAACVGSAVAFFTADNPRNEPLEQIFADGRVGGNFANLVTVADRRAAILEAARRARKCGGVLLITGKGHERHQEIGSERLPFDDREVLRSCLAELG